MPEMSRLTERRKLIPGTTGWTVHDLDDPRVEAQWEADNFQIIDGVLALRPRAYWDNSIAMQRLVQAVQRHLRERELPADFGMEVDGYFADSAVTVPVGQIRPETQKLLEVTREALDRAIDKMRAGNRLGDVGNAVQSWVEQHGYSVVREFVGHGIGTKMHDEPNLPNYGDPGRGARLQEGMVIAVEPMVNAGRPEVRMRDEWTAETADGSPSAHFEHTVAVTGNGPWILTRPKEMTGPSW